MKSNTSTTFKPETKTTEKHQNSDIFTKGATEEYSQDPKVIRQQLLHIKNPNFSKRWATE